METLTDLLAVLLQFVDLDFGPETFSASRREVCLAVAAVLGLCQHFCPNFCRVTQCIPIGMPPWPSLLSSIQNGSASPCLTSRGICSPHNGTNYLFCGLDLSVRNNR